MEFLFLIIFLFFGILIIIQDKETRQLHEIVKMLDEVNSKVLFNDKITPEKAIIVIESKIKELKNFEVKRTLQNKKAKTLEFLETLHEYYIKKSKKDLKKD